MGLKIFLLYQQRIDVHAADNMTFMVASKEPLFWLIATTLA
jgi:hypothetical protein